MPRRPVSQKAFTLIEVMMAAMVLVVGITSMIYSVTMGAEMLDTARKSQIAQQVLDAEVTSIRLADWGTGVGGIPGTVSYLADSANAADFLTIVIDTNGAANGLGGVDAMKEAFALTNYTLNAVDDNNALLELAKGYTVQLNVTTPPSRTDEYRIFSYTVQWASALGKPHTRRATTYVGRYGLAASHKR